MADFILRFQAADFSNTVFDMPNLSAIRGASLAYLYSPKLVNEVLGRVAGLTAKTIYMGASQGAWELTCDRETAKRAKDAVSQALGHDDDGTGPHSHLSYTVSVSAVENGNVAKALAVAEALNDTERYQGKGYPLPQFDKSVSGYDAAGDRTRPADKGNASSARLARQNFGRGQRQRFYRSYLGKEPSHEFTEDFGSMVADAPALEAVSPGSKTAVFYADGNKLGAARNAALKNGVDSLSAFSGKLKDLQIALLGSIVQWLETGARERPKHFLSDDRFRFETLMWGGDEVLFVMPSWLALEFAANFFEWTQGWDVGVGADVTFSAGLVIANHKTPIRQTKSLADDLAELNKDKDKASSAIQIEIFESISVPDTDLGTYRKKLYPGIHDGDSDALNAALAVPGAKLGSLLNKIGELKQDNGLPKSQLYALLRKGAVDSGPNRGRIEAPTETAFLEWKRRAGSGADVDWSDIKILGETVAPELSLAMLAMLWDYVDGGGNKVAGSVK